VIAGLVTKVVVAAFSWVSAMKIGDECSWERGGSDTM